MSQTKHHNALVLYRKRMGFSQKYVARLIGHKDATLLCMYERGRLLPPLQTAFRLSVVLRVPVEFLFGPLYDELKSRTRADEEIVGQHA